MIGAACMTALGLVFASSIQAQALGTVLGRLRDKETGKPLEGVTVYLAGTPVAVLSGSEGWYALMGVPPGFHQIRVSRMGFRPAVDSFSIGPGEALTRDFVLEPQPIPLEEVLVSVATPAREISGQRTVIRREELERRRAGSVSELLQGLIPGVNLTGAGGQVGASGSIRIRGIRSMQEQHPLFFVDGVRVGSARTSGPPGTESVLDFLDNINPADIERIEVVRNPEAAFLYGTDAGGGVILIFTRRSGSAPPVPAHRHP